MTAATFTPVKPCAKCGTAARYPSGNCKACQIARHKVTHPPAFKRLANPNQLFLDALPGTRQQIMAATGISPSSVFKCSQHLRTSGEAHIGSYELGKGRPSPVYVRGPGEDAKPPMTLKQARRLQEKPPKAPKPPKPPKLEKPGKPRKVLGVLTTQQAQAARERINARIAQRAEPRAARLVELAFSNSRTAFPLGAVWGGA